jgi:hypothetical protein
MSAAIIKNGLNEIIGSSAYVELDRLDNMGRGMRDEQIPPPGVRIHGRDKLQGALKTVCKAAAIATEVLVPSLLSAVGAGSVGAMVTPQMVIRQIAKRVEALACAIR